MTWRPAHFNSLRVEKSFHALFVGKTRLRAIAYMKAWIISPNYLDRNNVNLIVSLASDHVHGTWQIDD